MSKTLAGTLLLAAAALLLGACSDEEPSDTTNVPEIVTTTAPSSPVTSAPSTTEAEGTTTTTASPSSSTSTMLPLGELELNLVEVARGFEQPVLALSPPASDLLFVVDQPGQVWILAGDEPQLFLDIRDDVIFGGERGLLGLAFHPDFVVNGRFFVNYIGDRGQTKIVEITAASDRLTADPDSQQVLLEIEQPARNHNGGMLAFGPDGYLWIATGDGGAADDRFDQGQRPDTLLAALLRLDVSGPGTYQIPTSNPFLDGGGAPEVYSFGLRNPWRFSFDGDVLYVADVGQRDVEEINRLLVGEAAGANFGWPIFEGSECFRGPCDTEGTVMPVTEYRHNEGCSITGGFVYRGAAIPELTGHYFYADYCGGWIRSLGPDGEEIEWFGPGAGGSITSFGHDSAGEIYVVSQSGSIYRIERG